MILAGDIGGTKVNLAFYEVVGGAFNRLALATYPSRKYPTLQEIVREFFATHSLHAEHASFGIAGPVKDGRCQLTNLTWELDTRVLAQDLGLKTAWLINDLEANARGIAGLSPEDFEVLNPGEPGARGNAAIIAAGTGLGEAGLFWDGKGHRPLACEGGHAHFAPTTDLDIELFRHLRTQYGAVSWERVLSGSGFYNIYKFLRNTDRFEEPAWLRERIGDNDPSPVITQVALERKNELCMETLNTFVRYYGGEAGNLALKIMATGGVYVGGGIAPKIITKLKDGTFFEAFLQYGRMRPLLQAMPIKVILNDKTALLGAARHAAAQIGLIEL